MSKHFSDQTLESKDDTWSDGGRIAMLEIIIMFGFSGRVRKRWLTGKGVGPGGKRAEGKWTGGV